MLTCTNRFWKFKTSAELDEFLNSCIESEDEYQLSYGLSAKGDFYAYGSVVIKTKFGKKSTEKQEQKAEQQSEVTTF